MFDIQAHTRPWNYKTTVDIKPTIPYKTSKKMAEAAVESNSRYFCHTCSSVISPVLPDFLCPTCQGGFVEILSPEEDLSSSSTQTNTTDRTPRRPVREGDIFDMIQFFNDFVEDHADSAGNPPSRPRESTTNTQRGSGAPANLRLHLPRTSITFQNVGSQPIALMDVFNSMGGGTGNIFLPLPLLNLHGNPQDYVWGEGGLDTIITQLLNNVEGQGPPPASKDDIDKLETIKLTAADTAASSSNECPVCKDDFSIGDEVKKLPCEHIFHPDCVVTWLKMHNTCPVCRRAIGDVPRQNSGHTGTFLDPTGMI
ncbi:hypothetical protein HOLleu_29212 [Holothuria leucospilota]|uniref:RING-type E3 ubiquitin transferase n=1 Tax=Holothuria leucospilota TaxID=206669 RepID=A0A9Q1BN83_HOLLE|nr:hypothetical protein HOLleu_29212 [Holothuria leucospilota]